MLRGFRTIIFNMVPKVRGAVVMLDCGFETIMFNIVPKGTC